VHEKVVGVYNGCRLVRLVFHLEKYTRGGQNDTYRKFWGAKELCMVAHPLGGSGGMPPQKNF